MDALNRTTGRSSHFFPVIDFACESVVKRLQPGMPFLSHPAPSGCLETGRQPEKLPGEMVEGIAPIIQVPFFPLRVEGIIEHGAHAARRIETTGYAHGADGIQPISILKDASFRAFGC